MAFEGTQYPVAISTFDGIREQIFMVDKDLLISDRDTAVNNIFKEYFKYINEPIHPKTVFIHNLESFDGYLNI